MNAQQHFICTDRHAHTHATLCSGFSVLQFKLEHAYGHTAPWYDVTFANLSLLEPNLCFCLTFTFITRLSLCRHPAKEDSETPWPAFLGENFFLLAFTAHSLSFYLLLHKLASHRL